MSNTGAALAAEYEQARDAVIDAQAALEAAADEHVVELPGLTHTAPRNATA